MLRRALISASAAASLVLGAPLASTPANADPVNTLIGTGTWTNAFGASSSCVAFATATVACSHDASSSNGATEYCVGEGEELPLVTVNPRCSASLTGTSIGPGVAMGGEGQPRYALPCHTTGILTGRVDFSDGDGHAYPSVPVTIVNTNGHATFFGDYVNAAGVAIAHSEGTFELACGSPLQVKGAFSGSYTLL